MAKMSREALFISNLVLLSVIAGLLLHGISRKIPEVRAARDYSSQYIFTNPILDYEEIEMSHSLIWRDIEEKTEDLKNEYGLDFYSVYYRDLDNGQWIGLNEKEYFTVASLIKLPVLI